MCGYEQFVSKLGQFDCEENDDGIGYTTNRGRISWDLNRYLGVLCDLVQSRAFVYGNNLKIMEIGGGYGGLARVIMNYDPSISYLICDLEEVLFFSYVYLTNCFASERVLLNPGLHNLLLAPGQFYLVPQYKLKDIENQFDILINHQSMQEMTTKQVNRYLHFADNHCKLFYSRNMDHHSEEIRDNKDVVSGLNDHILNYFPDVFWKPDEYINEASYGDQELKRFIVYCSEELSASDLSMYKEHIRRLKTENAKLSHLERKTFNLSSTKSLADSSDLIDTVLLSTIAIRQHFIANQDGLNALRIKLVTWANIIPTSNVAWKLFRIIQSSELLVADGVEELNNILDWSTVTLFFSRFDKSLGGLYALDIELMENVASLGMPIFKKSSSLCADEYLLTPKDTMRNSCISLELVFSI